MRALNILLRIAIGALFIFSGVIKAVDPLGFSYKLDEYFNVFEKYSALKWMSADIFASNSLLLGTIMCILEVFLGIALILGTWMRFTTAVSLLLMIFFTFLTGFSAITDSVKDCGCFGDAIKLTPWESFTKDVVLTILLLPLFIAAFRTKMKSLPALKVVTLLGAVVSIAIPAYCYLYLPIIDFRPYKEGNNICQARELPENAKLPVVEMTFKYKSKTSDEIIEFPSAQFSDADFRAKIDANYEYLDRYDKVIQEGDVPKIQDFDLFLPNGNSATEFFLQSKGYKLAIVAYDLGHTNQDHWSEIADLLPEMKEKGIPTYALFSINPGNIKQQIIDQNELDIPFFTSDAIPLKTMIRSNPGLVLMQDCNVVKKWPGRSLPSKEELANLVAQQDMPSLQEFMLPEMMDLSGNSIKAQLLANPQEKMILVYGTEAMASEFPQELIDKIKASVEFNNQVLLVSEYLEEVPAEVIDQLEELGVLLVSMSEADSEVLFGINSGLAHTSAQFEVIETEDLNNYLD